MTSSLVHSLRSVSARRNQVARRRSSILKHIASHYGFISFGRVDQFSDEHHVVRGISASSHHDDVNYLVGSYDGQDIILVDRIDFHAEQKKPVLKRWLIAEVPLPHPTDIPHFYLVPKHHEHGLTASLSLDRSIETVSFPPTYSSEFAQRYSVLVTPGKTLELFSFLTPRLTQLVSVHFWPLFIEVSHNTLYVYSSHHSLSYHEVEVLIKNSTWFAQALSEGLESEKN